MKRFALGVLVLAARFAISMMFGGGATVTYDRTAAAKEIAADEARAAAMSASSTASTTGNVVEAIDKKPDGVDAISAQSITSTGTSTPKQRPKVVHQKTPDVVRAAYMTSCIASGSGLRAPMLKLLDDSSLNALVIDVKDYTGYISVDLGNPNFPIGGKSCLVKDMHEFLGELGAKGVYRIARIAVMQDPYYADHHPEEAVKRKDNGGVWKDKKGLAFVDPSSKDFWKYIRDVSVAAYDAGFDEVNFDYVRFPTDGNLANMSFAHNSSTTKQMVMKSFFTYIGDEMRTRKIPTSVDIFGMVTTASDDLGIGQYLEDIMPHFDYVAPMVYPSHYPKGFNNWKDPNTVPGPLTEFVMGKAVERAKAKGFGPEKFRTWIQDFNYGKVYTVADVRTEISSSAKVGVKSYMAWDPSNRYTDAAYMQPSSPISAAQ
jgi:hypothetical protein